MATKKAEEKELKETVVEDVTANAEQEQETKVTKKTTAKAGKRSSKSLEEAAQKLAKEERKKGKPQSEDSISEKPKVTPTRSKLERRSKSYQTKQELIDKDKRYSLEEASKEIGKTNPVKFDATIELHIRLNVDPRQAEQNVRDSVLLPAGSGKKVRVAAFVDGDDVATANDAAADLVGESAVIKELEAGSFSFDVLVATPSEMPKLGKYARLLGPRGLMPNPKSGTVTNDVAKAISEAKAGKVEYRVDSGGNLHIPVGKASFKAEAILNNLTAVMNSVQNNKPATIKGTYINSAYLSTTMGPSLKLAL